MGPCPGAPHKTSTEKGSSWDQEEPDRRRARPCGVAVGKDGEPQ